MNRTSAEATKMLITLERNLTIGLPPMVSNYCNLLQAVLLPKQIENKCCIFSAIHSLAANESGGLHHSTELIGNVFAARNRFIVLVAFAVRSQGIPFAFSACHFQLG